MKSSDSFKLGLVSFVAVTGIIIMTLFSAYNNNGYYGFAARSKGNIELNPRLSFEAESGTSQGFLIGQDPKASDKQYVYSPDGLGSISYPFDVTSSGLYKISIRAAADSPPASPLANSFYVQLNDNQKILVNAIKSNSYKWNDVSDNGQTQWSLNPGRHTIKIYAAGSNVKIDSIDLSLVASRCSDNDGDGYGKPRSKLCLHDSVDCNDLDASINPGAMEICNNDLDDNCNGAVDEFCLGEPCSDNDGDGYGSNCALGLDCDDKDPAANVLLSCNYNGNSCFTDVALCLAACPVPPQEICGNDVDENCDGVVEKCDSSVNGLFRSFSANPTMSGSTITVTLSKKLSSDQTTLLVEETVPSGFTIVNAGSGVATGNTIRWAELTGATSGTYTYTVTASATPGTYSFSGQYSINGGVESVILGNSSLVVESVAACQNGASQSCTTNLLGICSVGTQTCSNNSWGTCVALNPQPEICGNGVDEDCNGADLACINTTIFPVNTLVQAELGNNNGFTIKDGYVYSADENSNSISYVFNVPTSGMYIINTGIVNPNAGTNSFFIGLDGFNARLNNAYIYDTIEGTGVINDTVRLRGPGGSVNTWDYDPMVYNLTAGTHTFTFYGRERNTKMDYLTLSSYPGAIVCQNGQTQSCTTGLLGVCSVGTQTCSNNSWGTCVQNVQPSIEICGNGVDEDCSGSDLVCPNTPPVVSISSPVTGSTFNQGDNITVVALASDPNGSIAKVEFYRNNVLVRTDTTFPYSYSWNNAVIGNYTLYARAYDNLNSTSNSSPISLLVVPTEYCGNGVCEVTESCDSCSVDCGSCLSALSRGFSSNNVSGNSTVIVTLTKTLQSGQSTLLTEEYVPSGFVILNAGTGTASGNTIRWAELTGAQSGTYTYSVIAPDSAGSYSFSGQYSINGGDSQTIGGATLLNVYAGSGTFVCTSGQTQSCNTGLLGVCSVGTQTCSNNSWGTCVAPNPQPEICGNGVDEDCNGADLACVNTAPSVNVGIDRSVTLPNTLALSAIVTDDGLPVPPGKTTVMWTKQSGFGTVTFSNQSSINTTATFSTNGTYVLRLTANDSLLTGQDMLTVTVYPQPVNIPPTVSILSPTNGTNFVYPSYIIINANASDSDGSISKVEFYADGYLRGIDTTYPYSYVWTNASIGTHILTAKAYDNLNASTTSSPVNIGMIQPICQDGQTQSCATGLLGICSAGTSTCSNNNWGTCVQNNQPNTEICGNGIDEDCNGADLTCPVSGLSRIFPENIITAGSNFTVTIEKNLQSGQSTLLTEEYVPSGFVILNAGTGTASGNTIRWAELIGAASGTYTYTVRAPDISGSYIFSGLYSINGGAGVSIVGDTQLTVQ